MAYAGTTREQMIDYMNRAAAARDSALEKYRSFTQRYSLTAEGAATQHKEAVDSISGYIAEMIAEVRKRVNEDVESYDFVEKAELKKRFSNLEYQSMITAKADVLELIGDLNSLPNGMLQEYLKEFADDPVALTAFSVATKGRGLDVIASLPKDSRGLRQERIRNAFSRFENIMLAIGECADNPDLSLKADQDDFKAYLKNQTDNWEKSDEEVRAKANGWDVEPQKDPNQTFNFNFKHIKGR